MWIIWWLQKNQLKRRGAGKMINRIWCLVLLFAGLAVGCATTASRDMELANQGFEYLNQGNMAGAENYLNQSLAENPNNPYALLNLGVVYMRTGRAEQARSMFDKVIALDPKDIVSRSNEPGEVGKTLADLAKDNLKILK
jgi:tetratricopeptide (TPR) repeat protein